MEDSHDVLFCDLCNTSIPERDIETGTAMPVAGKVVGSCCLAELRKETLAPHAGEARLLPAVLVLLVAVAAATIFLDMRLSEELEGTRTGMSGVNDSLGDQRDRVLRLEERLGALARADQLRDLEGRLESLNATLIAAREAEGARLAAVDGSIVALRREIGTLGESIVDSGPDIARIEAALVALATEIAKSIAAPDVVARDAVVEPPVDTALPGEPVPVALPARLQAQVKRLRDEDEGTRFEAVDELLRSGNADVLPHVLPMVKDPDLFVRRWTVEGLVDYRQPKVIDALIEALLDSEEIVRATAHESLRKLTGQRVSFDPTASKGGLAGGQRRWQEWWEKNRDGFK